MQTFGKTINAAGTNKLMSIKDIVENETFSFILLGVNSYEYIHHFGLHTIQNQLFYNLPTQEKKCINNCNVAFKNVAQNTNNTTKNV